jgi:predicted transcriptional regulator
MLALAASYAGNKVGLLPESHLPVRSIASILNVSEKTIMNIGSSLVKKGLISRPKKGTFEMNAKGIAAVIGK